MFGYPNGLVPFGPSSNCTLDLCPVEWSVFQYRPSITANATFLAIFGLLLVIDISQGIRYKTWGHMLSVAAGNILQIIGYSGRIMLHENPFGFSQFLIQIICITVAPVFYCAAVYVLLSQFINATDLSVSRFNPRLFYWIFIPADVTCLVFQAVGGALSATGHTLATINVGVNITKAGLILQVVLLSLFISLFLDYLSALRKKQLAHMPNRMRILLWFLGLTVGFVFVRCIYRIIELADGYFGPNYQHQGAFIVLEGAVMSLAVVCLVVAHPGRLLQRSG